MQPGGAHGKAQRVVRAVAVVAPRHDARARLRHQGALVPVYEDQPVVVGSVTTGSPASTVDIRPGDRIVSAADRAVDTWEQFYLTVATRPRMR